MNLCANYKDSKIAPEKQKGLRSLYFATLTHLKSFIRAPPPSHATKQPDPITVGSGAANFRNRSGQVFLSLSLSRQSVFCYKSKICNFLLNGPGTQRPNRIFSQIPIRIIYPLGKGATDFIPRLQVKSMHIINTCDFVTQIC